MIKVLHYIPGFLYGGIESLFLDWYRSIDHKTVEFELLLRTQDDNAIALKQYREMNGKYYRLPKKSNLKEYANKVNHFFKKHHDYDIVHCHCSDAFVLAAAKRYHIKTIVHSHTTHIDGSLLSPKNLFFTIDSWFGKYFFTDYGFACSELSAKWMFDGLLFKRKKVSIIHNAIDTNKYRFNKEIRYQKRNELKIQDSFVIGHVGRMTYAKNQFFLLDIFKAVLELKSNSVLLMIGDGPDEDALKEYAKNHGIYDAVLFLGKRSDVPELMQTMDLFLLPSRYEGFGIVAIEAQASGLNVICSNLVPKEVDLTDCVDFISLNRSPDDWASRIVHYYNDKKRKDMSEQIKKAGFDIDTETKNMINKYRNIIKNQHTKHLR